MNDAGSITAAFDRITAKRLLIFDFDGTLADTSPLHAEAFADVLGPYVLPFSYESVAGLRTYDALERIFAGSAYRLSADELRELAKAKQSRVRELIRDRLKPLPGVEPFLRWAIQKYRMAICSSGSRQSVSVAIATLGIGGYFDPLVCAEDVVCAKPSPEGFLKVLGATGVSAEQALVFEDSSAGIQAAVRAGIEYVHVEPSTFELLAKKIPPQ